MKTNFDTHIEKNNTLLAKNDNLAVKYDILVGKHETLKSRVDELEEENLKCKTCDVKYRFDIQGSQLLLFTVLVILGIII